MKMWKVLGLAALSACSSVVGQGRDDSQGGTTVLRLAADGSISFKGLEFHCEGKQGGGGGGPTGKFDDCSDIPVVILESADLSKCWTLLPYNKLVVHRKDKNGTPRDVVIEWRLLQTDRFAFDTGKRGIDLKRTPQGPIGVPVDPEANHYADLNVSAKRIKWKLKGGAPIGFVFDHDAQVVRIRDNLACTAIDPLITNAD